MHRSVSSTLLCVVLAACAYHFVPRYWMYLPALLGQLRHPPRPNQQVEWKTPEDTQKGNRKDHPNVIVILVDDLGFNDISFFGGGYYDGSIQTPNIDSLGRDGVAFTHGYAGHATCAPSRASLLTGKFATRMGYEYTPINDWGSYVIGNYMNIGPLKSKYYGERKGGQSWGYANMSLPFSEITIAEALRPHGYRNIHLGKFHVGYYDAAAIHRGFDETLGFSLIARYLPSGDSRAMNCYLDDTFDNFIWANTQYVVRKDNGDNFVPDGSYMTDYLTKEAVAAIKANQNNPFFMYLALTSVHTPLSALKSDYDVVSADHPAWPHCDKVYAAMLMALDRGVGTVLQGLQEAGLSEDTMVIFTSDNGGPGTPLISLYEQCISDVRLFYSAGYIGQRTINSPYRGWKGTFFEGGVRTPFFIRWPARISASKAVNAVASHIDIFPTILAAAGVAVEHDVDGVNLLPFITQPQESSENMPFDAIHEKLYWRSGDYKALRAGDWKLQTSERPLKTWLYNLRSDPEERINLAHYVEHQDTLYKLLDMLEAEDKKQAVSIWPSLSESPILIDKISTDTYSENDEYVYWAN